MCDRSALAEPVGTMIDGSSADARTQPVVSGGGDLESWAAQNLWAKLVKDESDEWIEPLHVFFREGGASGARWIVILSRKGRTGWSQTDWSGLAPSVCEWCPAARLLIVGLTTGEPWSLTAQVFRDG
jgi:hypothetical protein